jgi:hypothetical protein
MSKKNKSINNTRFSRIASRQSRVDDPGAFTGNNNNNANKNSKQSILI